MGYPFQLDVGKRPLYLSDAFSNIVHHLFLIPHRGHFSNHSWHYYYNIVENSPISLFINISKSVDHYPV